MPHSFYNTSNSIFLFKITY